MKDGTRPAAGGFQRQGDARRREEGLHRRRSLGGREDEKHWTQTEIGKATTS